MYNMAKLIQKYQRGLLNSNTYFEEGDRLLKPAQQEVLSQNEEHPFTSPSTLGNMQDYISA